jgi:hypothetical protein
MGTFSEGSKSLKLRVACPPASWAPNSKVLNERIFARCTDTDDQIIVSKDMDTYTRRLPLGVCARSVVYLFQMPQAHVSQRRPVQLSCHDSVLGKRLTIQLVVRILTLTPIDHTSGMCDR